MKRHLAAVVMAALAVSLLGAPSGAAPKQQSEEGTVLMPAPFTDDTGCYAGVHRRLNAVFSGNHNGLVGYQFEVDKATWNKPFILEASGQGDADLDIYFYLGPLTTLDDVIAAGPGDPAPPATISYNTRAPGGEHDIVPKLAENVIICMYAGAQGAGFAADFTYTAGKGVKKPK